MNNVVEQLNRTKRWSNKLNSISRSEAPAKDIDEYNKDTIYAFFQSCLHIRDWIIASYPAKKAAVDNFIESNTDLKICRDICNGSKHLNVKDHSVDPNISKSLHSSVYSTNMTSTGTDVIYWVTVNNLPLDVLQLAQCCVIHWEGFLVRESLIPITRDSSF